jgi:NADP-dependent 3-hydroxy acid dehydrogenase YdfG
MTKTAFITGATSGIGYATAVTLAKQGYRIIATGRREERLKQLAEELHGITTVLPLLFDVTDKEAVFNSVNTLPKEWDNIDVLVNNAGNAHGLSPIQEGSLEDWEAMLDINVKGLLYVSKAIIPKMIEKQKGHIVNIGSIAGKEVYANGNVYCASKHAVDAINASMRIDLLKENIKVSQVAPGLVETEFSIVRFKGDAERSKQVYTGYDALQAEDIADLISFIVTRPAHVNIADTLILPSAQAASTLVYKND